MKLNSGVTINGNNTEILKLYNLASSGALTRRNEYKENSVDWIYYDELRISYDALQVEINKSLIAPK